jgi:hypothetical protein
MDLAFLGTHQEDMRLEFIEVKAKPTSQSDESRLFIVL